MKKILCYGDSNTWGYIPGGCGRYSKDIRWPGVVQNILGNDYKIIEDGINGRTTCFDKGWGDCKNGKTGLGFSLLANYPLDCVVVMLGTNDLTEKNATFASKGVAEIVRLIKHANAIYRSDVIMFEKQPKILLVSPITLNENIDESLELMFKGQYKESLKFAELYKKVADDNQIDFLDAALYASASFVDSLHMDENSHRLLGEAIAYKLKEML